VLDFRNGARQSRPETMLSSAWDPMERGQTDPAARTLHVSRRRRRTPG
jgi:hypothetical protein